MPFIRDEAGSLYYARHRSECDQAPALVLIHGAGGSHLHWPGVLRNLAQADVYALDLPGHGRSGVKGRSSIADYADSVLGFMDALGLDSVIPIGHSMGSAIALALALKVPDRVDGLILVGSGARLRVLPALLAGTLEDFGPTVKTIVEYCYGGGAADGMKRAAVGQMLELSPQVVHDDFAACDAFDVMENLGAVRAPTLVVTGAEDIMTPPKYARYLAEHIPDSRLVLVEGAGHMVMLEQPETVAQATSEFLSGLRDR
jgi:pimeloyl-ACP methyl ester carboxylesterase